MVDIRKIIIIFVIGILFSVLVFSTIEAVYPQPEWEDYCKMNNIRAGPITVKQGDCAALDVPIEVQEKCTEDHGYIDYKYDSVGCAESYYCETCQYEYDQEMDKYNQYVFYISAVLALIAIFIGLYLPAKKNSLNEWIGTGFMLGGAFALFFGTVRSFTSLGRYTKPIVIFLELILIIFLAYKKIGNLRPDKKK
ncbi:MAG: hypothetical protein KJ601_03765 [Nanoarchaeota archaeon]|nr:hypothetical protein [Nanoarchaeota archaeon]MBU1705093.1 hypothetical protein [Nanoarchaeota archaeon]